MKKLQGQNNSYILFKDEIGKGQYGKVFKAVQLPFANIDDFQTEEQIYQLIQSKYSSKNQLNSLQIQAEYIKKEESKVLNPKLPKYTKCNTFQAKKFKEQRQPYIPKQSEFYAIKAIDKSRLNQDDLKNIENEIYLLEHLNSLHVLKMKEKIEDKRFIYIVTELCNGGDLENLLKFHEKFRKEILIQKIMSQLCLGLYHMHHYSIAHRDLKLSNIFIHFPDLINDEEINMTCLNEERLLEEPFLIKIGDLGFAKQQEGEDLYSYCGTPLNMAPEVITNQSYDLKADVWSLGVSMFELITGQKPFTSITQQGLVMSLMQGKYFIPKSINISLSCLEFLNQCLQFDSEERISIQELITHPFIKEQAEQGQQQQNQLLEQQQQQQERSYQPEKVFVSNYESREIIQGQDFYSLAQPYESQLRLANQEQFFEIGIQHEILNDDLESSNDKKVLMSCMNKNVFEIQPSKIKERFDSSSTEIPLFQTHESTFTNERLNLATDQRLESNNFQDSDQKGQISQSNMKNKEYQLLSSQNLRSQQQEDFTFEQKSKISRFQILLKKFKSQNEEVKSNEQSEDPFKHSIDDGENLILHRGQEQIQGDLKQNQKSKTSFNKLVNSSTNEVTLSKVNSTSQNQFQFASLNQIPSFINKFIANNDNTNSLADSNNNNTDQQFQSSLNLNQIKGFLQPEKTFEVIPEQEQEENEVSPKDKRLLSRQNKQKTVNVQYNLPLIQEEKKDSSSKSLSQDQQAKKSQECNQLEEEKEQEQQDYFQISGNNEIKLGFSIPVMEDNQQYQYEDASLGSDDEEFQQSNRIKVQEQLSSVSNYQIPVFFANPKFLVKQQENKRILK